MPRSARRCGKRLPLLRLWVCAAKKIAVIGETSPQWVCTYLGALAAGCVIVPMDKELDTEEIRRFIAMVDARAIVYSKSFNEKFIKSISDGDTGIRYFIPITPAYDSSFRQ
ncbi:MAG: AMP-binding protein [Oscillospiraceae bacterium]|nr:MAG: AMP-binding protein [Oscillospiraceae bacterium]